MMKGVYFGIIAVMIVVIGGAFFIGTFEYPELTSLEDIVKLENEQVRILCAEKGGEVYQASKLSLSCALPTTDGGKSCMDSNQCDGYCIPMRIVTMSEPGALGNFQCEELHIRLGSSCYGNMGVCSDSTRFPNCGSEFVDGKIESVVCID